MMTTALEPRQDYSLAQRTSLKVGGPADWYAEPRSIEELRACQAFAMERGLRLAIIGGGSNMLIAEAGIDGLVLRPRLDHTQTDVSGSSAQVIAGAGVTMSSLARRLARDGWSGLEWAANVPGSVGGAIVNNAGAFGSSTAESLDWCEILDARGMVRRLNVAEIGYAYRSSRIKHGDLAGTIVLRGAFHLAAADRIEATERVKLFQRQRTISQPRQLSAGSVFANPPGDYSGRLLEGSDLKGSRVGDAEISTHHANFIVNHGNATANDVYRLMRRAQDEVWRRFHVWLTPEIELVGRWTDAERAALRGPEENQ
jgi:UDP-N-acetylmuramate dehydrogenase